MSGPETGGPPSGPKTDRLLAGLDAVIGHVMTQLAPASRLLRGGAMRTSPHPVPKPPANPDVPKP